MNVIRFDRRRKTKTQRKPDVITPLLAALAVVAVCALGWVSADKFLLKTATFDQRPSAAPAQTRVSFSMCGRERYTCIVDGDTIWLGGKNLRLQSYDTPEPYRDICGGATEVALAKRASARLLELLNSNMFTVDTFGLDNTGERTLATIKIAGRDVGDILIEERLARRWPDGDEWWCQ
ncbi:MAG TPA: thermonuclease family protein [Devosia sp.]|jgi:endonuclease YncB( thermonuclease family)|uniref:thermonuclease family protein n=1 Tax=Devosia sp. TaxID=1871048 RepID=UPI002F9294BF